jgi:DNA polymerase III subunit epsilon
MSDRAASIAGLMGTNTKLANLEVLIVDCQATGASPKHGHLLELAWCKASSKTPVAKLAVHSHLVALPRGGRLPPRISKMTGIERRHLKSAIKPATVWRKLVKDLVPKASFPTVIHFARFEKPFLIQLNQAHSPRREFPFELICTHEISKRLLPTLPRRSLRALVGYFGHNPPDLKRAADHVRATLLLWKDMVALLEKESGLKTLADLLSWLKEPPPKKNKRHIYPMSRTRRLTLPDEPGVYRLLGPRAEVLYVGKATSLKTRVNSYFQKQKSHTERSLEMLTRVQEVSVSPTESALEAALLEVDQIRHYQPPYNIALQEQDPRVWFLSDDLNYKRSRPDRRHRHGPLLDARDLISVGRLAESLQTGRRQKPVYPHHQILRVPKKFGPDAGCYRKGLAMFRKRHAVSGLAELVKLGGQLWFQEPDSIEPDAPELERVWSWDPESVVAALERVVIQGAFLLRRSRWLCWLSESRLTWKVDRANRLISFHKGSLTGAETIATQSVARPPEDLPDWQARRLNFSSAVYDRLRVLTTELRRLAANNRRLRLLLAPRITLNRDQLAKVLAWL